MFTSYLRSIKDKPEFKHVIETLRAKMPQTRFRAFTRDLRLYRRYCRAYRLQALPADVSTTLRYIAALKRNYAANTIGAMLTPVCRWHTESGYRSPRYERLVSLTLKATKKHAKKERVATSMTPELFREFMELSQTRSAVEIRTRAVVACAFWGMVSAIELGELSLDRCEKSEQAWRFFDVGRRHRTITLERAADSRYCPLVALELYIKMFKVRSGALWRACAFNGQPRTTPTSFTTLRRDVETSTVLALPQFAGLTFNSFKCGGLEAAFHAGVDMATLMGRAGFCNQLQLERRLRQVLTPRPGDRPLPHGGQRAPGRRLPPKRKFWLKTGSVI